MSTQPDPTVAAARSSRGRSRSHNSVATTLVDEDSNVGRTATIVEMELLTPQIAPGNRKCRFPGALDERETRQLMRNQSLRLWWHIRGRMHNHGGVDIKVLKTWMNLGFPASPTSVDGIPLASPEYNVVVDPVKEKAPWDTWGRQTWLALHRSFRRRLDRR